MISNKFFRPLVQRRALFYAGAQKNGVAMDEALNTSPQGLKLVVRVDAEFALSE